MSNEITNTGTNTILRKQSPSLLKLEITNFNRNESYDLRYIFTELNIYSSIDGVFASGDVTISEQGNLISTAPLDGREFIEIEFCSLKNSYESYHRLFFVYAIDNLSEFKDVRTYTIRFTDVFGIINPDVRISYTYKKKKLEDIIQEVQTILENPEMGFEDYKQILNNHSTIPTGNKLFFFKTDDDLSVETAYNVKFVVPEWHPLKLITYLTQRATSTDSSSLQEYQFSDCLFFQNRKGEFILTNYKKMFNTQLSSEYSKNIEFKKEIANLNTQSSNNSKDTALQEVKYAVQKYDLNKIYNVQSQKQIGFFGFTECITDFVNARCEPITVTNEEIQSIILQYGISNNQYPYESIKKTENGVFYYDACGMNMSQEEDEYNKFTLPYIKGVAIRQYLEYAKIIIEMNGVSDIDIGKYVTINLGMDLNNNSITQYVNDSRWVISKYAHRFLADGTYTTVVECFTPYLNRSKDFNNTQSEKMVQEGNDLAVSLQNMFS